jgi:hypothetical protein
VRDVFQERRLARFRRRDDETALAFADRREQIEHARGETLRLGLELEHLVRIDRDQLGERPARLAILLERQSFDGLQADELEAVAGAARRAGESQTGLQMEALDERARHDRVALLLHVAVGGIEQDAGAVRFDEQDAGYGHELARRHVDRSGAASVLLTHGTVAAAAFAASPATRTSPATAGLHPRPEYGGCASFPGDGPLPLPGLLPLGSGTVRAASAATPLTRGAIVWCHLFKNSKMPLLSFSPVPGADDVMAEDQVSTPRGMPDAKSSRKVQRQYGEVAFENQAGSELSEGGGQSASAVNHPRRAQDGFLVVARSSQWMRVSLVVPSPRSPRGEGCRDLHTLEAATTCWVRGASAHV